ncbi:hypothetical protein N0V93_005661 [Gnomoniopsis smithogilvyi]|uniref:Uncharacterized protein n=1 Tax=Gnomoniopsis smithogilvyi TaxID=1191159 RepID=A0A9W8YV10_9PEZI|nr:hypothetical protein N0V93_005661 [Gnomoniopsis smithogilvyi]
MAGRPAEPPTGQISCPGSPRPRPACAIIIGHDVHETNIPSGEDAPVLPPIAPAGPVFGRWARGAPPGFEHLRPRPSDLAGDQIPPAGTVFGTQGHPPPSLIFGSQPPYPTEIFHSQIPPPGAIFGNQTPPDEVVFGNHPSPGGISGKQPPSLNAVFDTHSHNNSDPPLRPMHKCFALASTRVYDKSLRCDRCGGRSDLGWYYRCSHETDARLFESIRNGNEEHFDEIGQILTQNIQQPTRGPAARQDKLSPLNELPADQLESLSAPQLAKVLRQHEAAVNTALTDRHGPSIPPTDEKPFLMPQIEECRTSLCPRCGRAGAGEQQSFLNLDGVLKGDIPPSAAVGFGFRALGGRPVANANIVRNLGLRDPKTGLLPGQKATDAAAVSAVNGGKSEEAKDVKLVERTSALKLDDAETSEDSEGPKTPDTSQKADDSDEDLVQLYLDSEENNADPVPNNERVDHTEISED